MAALYRMMLDRRGAAAAVHAVKQTLLFIDVTYI